MKRNSFYPSRLADQVIWLLNAAHKLPGHAAALGLSPAQVAAFVADCLWVAYVLSKWLPGVRAWALGCTDAAAETQTGTGSAAQVLPVFTPPEPDEDVVPVAPGALDRIFVAVQMIKDSGKCTDSIASDLGLVGTEDSGPDMGTVQPELKLKLTPEGVFIGWGWGGYVKWLHALEIEVDRGDGKGFVYLVVDTTPNNTDTFPRPVTPTKWTYRAIYHVDAKRVGLWSTPVSIIVGA